MRLAGRRFSHSQSPRHKNLRHGILALCAPDALRQERKLRLWLACAHGSPNEEKLTACAGLAATASRREFLCSFGLRLKRDIPSITTTLNPKGRMPSYRALRRASSAGVADVRTRKMKLIAISKNRARSVEDQACLISSDN